MFLSKYLNEAVCAQENERSLSLYEGRVWPISSEADLLHRLLSAHLANAYSTKKKESLLYRRVFYSLSFLFICLIMIIYFHTLNVQSTYFFYPCIQIKSWVMILSFVAALLSFLVGVIGCPEKEAHCFLAKKIDSVLNSNFQ